MNKVDRAVYCIDKKFKKISISKIYTDLTFLLHIIIYDSVCGLHHVTIYICMLYLLYGAAVRQLLLSLYRIIYLYF